MSGEGGRTGRTFAEVYGSGEPIPPDEITEWLLDAEDYIPRLGGAGEEPLARFLVAAYFIIRQLIPPGHAAALDQLAAEYRDGKR